MSFHTHNEIVSAWKFSYILLASYDKLNLIFIISMIGKIVKSSLEVSSVAVRDSLTSPAVTYDILTEI